MTAPVFELFATEDDNDVELECQLLAGGAAVDLTTATDVDFVFKNRQTGTTTTVAGTVVTAASGIVNVTLTSTHLASPGACDCVWVVTFTGGAVRTFPTAPTVDGAVGLLHINPKLA